MILPASRPVCRDPLIRIVCRGRACARQVKELEGPFEIVSLVGTLTGDSCHLHASLSDKDGVVCGGHVVGGMEVYTTAEVVLGHCLDAALSREPDATTGYDELVVRPRV